ncbi:MAG: hypothetical protein ACOYYS_23225 [Chloroflexota bacterium]
MKHKTKLAVSLAALALLLFASIAASVAFAQTSHHFSAVWSRFASGGGERQSTHYQAQDILGQWVSESPSSTNAQVVTNFFYDDALPKLYLPIIVRH